MREITSAGWKDGSDGARFWPSFGARCVVPQFRRKEEERREKNHSYPIHSYPIPATVTPSIMCADERGE
jgi:hypothetical protein